MQGQPPITAFDRDVLRRLIDVHSHDFLLRGDIVLDGLPFTRWSVLRYQQGDIRIVARSSGSDEALTGPAAVAPPDAR